MKRSKNMELAQRINYAYFLLKKDIPSSEILESIKRQYGVSRVQAYRYIRSARENHSLIPIPESSVVFTVKLGTSLIKRIKATASSMGVSISTVVKMALEEFLSKPNCGKKKEKS
jgi:G:T/U-mismatch repair DNA glycosylase